MATAISKYLASNQGASSLPNGAIFDTNSVHVSRGGTSWLYYNGKKYDLTQTDWNNYIAAGASTNIYIKSGLNDQIVGSGPANRLPGWPRLSGVAGIASTPTPTPTGPTAAQIAAQQAAAQQAAAQQAAALAAQQAAAQQAAAQQAAALAAQQAAQQAAALAAKQAADAAAKQAADAAAALAAQQAAAYAAMVKARDTGTVFTRFDLANDVVENQKIFLTTGLFSNTTNGKSINAATMSVIFTSSIQPAASKQYYYETWNKNPDTSADSEPQFSIAYGHRRGSGSSAAGTLNDAPTRAVYSQYKLLLLNPEDTQFTFKDGTSTDSIYAINFNRARILEKLDPGNWQLTLAQLSGSSVPNNAHTGSNVKLATNPSYISLIDDSGDTQELNVKTVARVVNVVSGSITGGIHNPSAPHYYGLMYPDMGVIILNDNKLTTTASFNTVTGSNIAGDNAWKLYTSISGAFSADQLNNSFQSRNSIIRTSAHFFVRVRNTEYNFSNNPTFVTGSEGTFSQPTFVGDPKVYITTVGMYNDRQELLAVGKLSQPIQKSFSKESLIKVRLDF
jgi:hypothetical protein